MEGGIKRGLVGSVIIGEDAVQIAAQGPAARLQSFANWIESSSMLVTGVQFMGLDACPAEGLTTKFPLADAEGWSGATCDEPVWENEDFELPVYDPSSDLRLFLFDDESANNEKVIGRVIVPHAGLMLGQALAIKALVHRDGLAAGGRDGWHGALLQRRGCAQATHRERGHHRRPQQRRACRGASVRSSGEHGQSLVCQNQGQHTNMR